MQVSFSKAAPPKSGALAIPCFEDGAQPAAFDALDEAAQGALSRAIKAAAFKGKKDQTLDIVAPAGLENTRVLLVGAGARKELGPLEAEAVGAAAVARLLATRDRAAAFLLDGVETPKLAPEEFASRVALGAKLRAYRFDKYRTRVEKDKKPALTRLTVHTAAARAKTLFADYEKVAEGVFLTRDLVSEPPNVLYPESFAERCRELESLGVKVKILGEAQMAKLGMGALLGVGQGSVRESKLVAMEWMGGKKGDAPVAFVGKGVTFDTGGISLKPGPGMEDMKWDMGGAGAVTGAIAALAGRKAKANVVGVIGLVENMPDGNAQRPADIVTTMSGQTVEILNTDAEGRLVLADAVWWTQETYKPKTVIDLATLTGAIIISLAHEYAGLFTRDDDLAASLAKAGEAAGDRLWRMPLDKAHDEMLKSDIADMKNVGPKEGGSSSAAAFIGRFIKDGVAWAHLDIAGKAWTTKDLPTAPKGATGYGVRLLDQWVRENCEKQRRHAFAR
ncbi:leucyl aminopeptidase [Amphiplicatus metriothermophilus]|uniref:Probable cytosol aminopeptidase n=1 Tax=Amphiplicatus metriothermophilus TaxID=1519374 RepID=A0A239PY51_9PROT|nr:leucyl aminopeptidase [Amphiplicatus metriothermophilus]MBB5519789.1 leucyl aminopeptidase [Amphiplicatus metriothermophilus]SNT75185.1 leucyl aminopeptidase [Amphiplicatus metriothermophilus]